MDCHMPTPSGNQEVLPVQTVENYTSRWRTSLTFYKNT